MSQENVELVRSIVEGWNRGDYSVVLESVDAGIEVEAALGGTFDGTYQGPAQAQRFLEDFWRNFEQSHTDIEEYIPVGDSVVFAAHLRGKGKGSGVEVEMRNWQVCTIRDRKVIAYRMFTSKRQALEAAGLSE
jgi:ketosteroid isomerase-like protein